MRDIVRKDTREDYKESVKRLMAEQRIDKRTSAASTGSGKGIRPRVGVAGE